MKSYYKISFTIIVLVSLVYNGLICAVRPEIISEFESVPSIDGFFKQGEWDNPQVYIPSDTQMNGYTTVEAFYYFKNDLNYLYIMVDAIGDVTEDDGDECLFWFHCNGVINKIKILGFEGMLENDDYKIVAGYGSSPNNQNNHRIYEWKIKLNYLNAVLNQQIDICSPFWKNSGSAPYDYSTGNDNVWPPGLNEQDISTWGLVHLSEPPVGGELYSSTMAYPTILLASMILMVIFHKLNKHTLEFN